MTHFYSPEIVFEDYTTRTILLHVFFFQRTLEDEAAHEKNGEDSVLCTLVNGMATIKHPNEN